MMGLVPRRACALALVLSFAAACGSNEEADAALDADALASVPTQQSREVCAQSAPGFAHCHAHIRVGPAASKPQGLGPAELRAAYDLPKSSASPTVAIVDAYDDPSAEADLAVYRKQFGLPACTAKNGCFRKVGQTGTSTLPDPDGGWAQEIALDLDMVSAACPSCRILLVEANSESMSDLGAAIDTAAKLGAAAISNSWGGGETPTDTSFNKHLSHKGVLITASSGDDGFGVEFPAASPDVLAVGGTRLVKSSSARGWAESAWSGAGSGCSQFQAKPRWQTDASCSKRTVADVSAVADPATGVAVYVSSGDAGGWNVFGGTSVASPLIAAIFALTGASGQGPGFAYAQPKAFHDVRSGKNGSCSAAYLCAGHSGYDGPTGVGTPDGKSMAAAAAK
jgi:hypothetical protein